MIVSTQKKELTAEFASLMKRVDDSLNAKAKTNPRLFQSHNGSKLEEDVFYAMRDQALNTKFDKTIKLISGFSFPDIVANNFWGVEVKSTKSNSWKSIGSSILESTRNGGVERIFLTFGKLCSKVEFMTRPYESCLYDIAITHYPRYQIDMLTENGKTIFDKMGLPYDQFRNLSSPVQSVAQYYKKKLKPGESLWWLADNDMGEKGISPVVKFWSNLSLKEKEALRVEGMVRFPEIFCAPANYERLASWLVVTNGVVCSNVRDIYSAGGVKSVLGVNNIPAVWGRLYERRLNVKTAIVSARKEVLEECWNTSILPNKNRISLWCELVALHSRGKPFDRKGNLDLLKKIFSL